MSRFPGFKSETLGTHFLRVKLDLGHPPESRPNKLGRGTTYESVEWATREVNRNSLPS